METRADLKCPMQENLYISERRIIYDYEKYGDSPACIGDKLILENQIALTQGFGINENTINTNEYEKALQETNVTVISNDECYEKASKINNPIVKQSAKRAMPEGVTDQILCTLGILVELENGRTVVSVR